MAADGKSITVGIWLLERSETTLPGELSRCIIIAGSEKEARQTANSEAGTEGYVWTDGTTVSATLLGEAAGDVEAGFYPLKD